MTTTHPSRFDRRAASFATTHHIALLSRKDNLVTAECTGIRDRAPAEPMHTSATGAVCDKCQCAFPGVWTTREDFWRGHHNRCFGTVLRNLDGYSYYVNLSRLLGRGLRTPDGNYLLQFTDGEELSFHHISRKEYLRILLFCNATRRLVP